jgi:UDP-N-acetyl-D-mannosaminuronic acid dehydrogenase
MTSDPLVLLESTVPVGTTEALHGRLARARPDLPRIDVAYCPERALPGDLLAELGRVPRVVGGVHGSGTKRAADLLRSMGGAVTLTTARTAELCKLTENSARDVHIALANQLASVAVDLGVDPDALFDLVNQHPRVTLLRPGIGVGGHCLPVDPWFLIAASPAHTDLLRQARAINTGATHTALATIRAAISRTGATRVALLGLAYKANTGDIRNSPAMRIALALASESDLEIRCADPFATPDWPVPVSPADVCLREAQLVVLLVDHHAYRGVMIPPAAAVLDLCGARK